jgi:site-specific DNA-methyltransferase (adenine-specific)
MVANAPYYEDEHVTLFHGDCREVGAWLTADVLVTDPPYGINWKGTNYVGWEGVNTDKAIETIANDKDVTARDEILGRFGFDKSSVVFGSALAPCPPEARQVLVWRKPPQLGLFGAIGGFRRDWEAVYLVGDWGGGNQDGRTAILESRSGSQAYLGKHPHAKPIWLMETLISHCPSGVVADPFSGSGSTLVAARNLGRRAVGVELEERYCEITARRLSQMCLDFEAVM